MKRIFLLFTAGLCLFASTQTKSQSIEIRYNQFGYDLNEPKSAICFSAESVPEKFSILDSRGSGIFEGKIVEKKGSWGEYSNFGEADFSSIKNPGTYQLKIGNKISDPFVIGKNPYAGLPDTLLEFMRLQRCGYNPFYNCDCHQHDGRSVYGRLPKDTKVDVRGGWHDAGDMLKYMITSSNATAQMLSAWVIRKDYFQDTSDFQDKFDHLGRPGGNEIADLLDEAKWGLDWMLKMHPEPDLLYHQVADDRDHCGWRLPQNEHADYGYGPGMDRTAYCADGFPQGLQSYQSNSDGMANIAGRYAAAMGLGYQVWKDDPKMKGYAGKLLQAGKEVYELGKNNPGVQQGNSYKAPYRYEESTWADDMEWGAAELFRATGEEQYLNDAMHFAEIAESNDWMGRRTARHYYFYPFMNMGHFRLYELVDKSFAEKLSGWYREGIERSAAMAEENPFEIGVPFIWCSNNLATALATQCRLYRFMTGKHDYDLLEHKQYSWLSGLNPWGYSMFTEIPENGVSPKDVHLPINPLLHKTVRGGLVDGPVYHTIFAGLKGAGASDIDPLKAYQGTAVYHDHIKDYATNEPTMDGTASAILMWAILFEKE